MTYEDIGLDGFLRATNSPASAERTMFDATMFEGSYDMPVEYFKSARLTAGNLPFTTNISWSADASDEVSWSNGTISWASGSVNYIAAGTAGSISAETFVYFQRSHGTAFRTSNAYTDAVGDDRRMMAILNTGIGGGKASIKLLDQSGDVWNFNQASGGTIALGGTANGDGVLTVSNEGGTEIVKLDKTGISVTDGSISIKDKDSTTFINSQGLVSSSNFIKDSDEIVFSGGTAITGTAYQDLGNASLNIQVPKDTNVLVYTHIDAYNSGAASYADFRLAYGWYNWGSSTYVWTSYTNVGWVWGSYLGTSGYERETITAVDTEEFSYHDPGENAPTHQIKIQWRCGNGGTAYCYRVKMGYVRLG